MTHQVAVSTFIVIIIVVIVNFFFFLYTNIIGKKIWFLFFLGTLTFLSNNTMDIIQVSKARKEILKEEEKEQMLDNLISTIEETKKSKELLDVIT